MTLSKTAKYVTIPAVVTLLVSIVVRVALAAAGPSCEVLIAARDLNHCLKGYPLLAKNVPAVWGTQEGLPDWVIIRITDTSADTVNDYFKQWHKVFDYDIINENELGYRIRVQVDPNVVSVSNVNKAIRAEMKAYATDAYDGELFSYDDFEAVIDIPKPITLNGEATTFAEMKEDLHDKWAEQVDYRRYYFSGTDVNAVISAGGLVERTKAQVQSAIIDKLDE